MKVYLAGPDVFRPDVVEWAASARTICRRYGHEPLMPIDHGETEAPKIYQANIDLIGKAQIVVANLNPFRDKCDCGEDCRRVTDDVAKID